MSQTGQPRIGWIGVGRMGYALVERLLQQGCQVAVWNRTRSKAEPLVALGATLVDRPVDLADCHTVFTTVSDSAVFIDVTTGEGGLLTDPDRAPRVLVDSSTISEAASEQVRAAARKSNTAVIAAPVSGNAKVVKAGMLSVVASGPRDAFDEVAALLELFGRSVTYVGENDAARLVKICHNVLLGVVTQCLAEITVLAERGGVARSDVLGFINDSVMGSVFSRYKTPAFVNLEFKPTFTGHLLRKDLELGLDAGRDLDVPMPVTAVVHQRVLELIGNGLGDVDFAALLELEARNAGLTLEPEGREVDDGLAPVQG